MSFAASLRRFAGRVRRDESAVAAVEFALVLPVMLTMLVGGAELANAMTADKKVSQAAATAADLVAQDNEIRNAEMNDIMDALRAIMFPFTDQGLTIRITSVQADAQGRLTVAWSDARGIAPRAAGAAVTLPQTQMVQPGGSVIWAEVTYQFQDEDGMFLTDGVTMEDQFYLRPRRSLTVVRTRS